MKSFAASALTGTLALVAFGLAGCEKGPEAAAQTGTVALQLASVVGTAPLDLSATTYRNANGDTFTVSTFKYYVSNVTLRRTDNSTYLVPDSYFLVDQDNPGTRELKLTGVPVGEYTSISFTVGVDSARTKSGNYPGVLNASNGMFWDMNGPEFINLKLEGRSPQSPRAGLVFHIAGYKRVSTNTIRTVSLPFPAAKLAVRANHSATIHAKADVLKLFTGPHPIRFADVYNEMGGATTAKMADNIAAGMFSVEHVMAH